MSDPENIIRYKETALWVLKNLYEEHPEGVFFDVKNFFNRIDEQPGNFDATVDYLINNGYLHSGRDFHLTLNDKSWAVLNKKNPLDPQKTIGAELASWSKDSAKNAISTIGKKAIEILISSIFNDQ